MLQMLWNSFNTEPNYSVRTPNLVVCSHLQFVDSMLNTFLLVACFAKKTGDYGSLSAVDLKLIALTYQLKCELGYERGANLRSEPCENVSVDLLTISFCCRILTTKLLNVLISIV